LSSDLFGVVVKTLTTKKGHELVIRHMLVSDAEVATEYINELSSEDTFITFSGEQLTIEEEQKYYAECAQQVKNHHMIHLLCFCDGKLIGVSNITRDLAGKKRSYHVGTFGISVRSAYRGEGVGEILMRTTIEETKKHIPGLRLIKLFVYGENTIGQRLYSKVGFKEYSRLPQGVYFHNQFCDEIGMYLAL